MGYQYDQRWYPCSIDSFHHKHSLTSRPVARFARTSSQLFSVNGSQQKKTVCKKILLASNSSDQVCMTGLGDALLLISAGIFFNSPWTILMTLVRNSCDFLRSTKLRCSPMTTRRKSLSSPCMSLYLYQPLWGISLFCSWYA